MQHISIGFSPCPNDTFMFDALVNRKINTFPFAFSVFTEDVETLNRHALQNKYDVTKLSFNAYASCSKNYRILNSGSALGRGCGPILISKRKIELSEVKNIRIAIPGINTTANLLLNIFFPDAKRKTEIVFSKIEDSMLNEQFDAGLIIHENRFTYQQKGLLKIADMGELWEQTTGYPIPLGCIAIKRTLDDETQNKIDRIIRTSIEHAYKNPADAMNYVRQHAQEMNAEVIQKHIDLYVNDFSLDLGAEGKKTITFLFQKGKELGLLAEVKSPIFLE